MTLVRTSILNAIALAVRLLTGIALGKLLAVTVGPAGFAIVGQFQSLVAVATSFAGGAINNGVVKFTAENGGSLAEQQRYWRTASKIAFFASVAAGSIIVVTSSSSAKLLLDNEQYAGVISAFGVALPLVAVHYLLLAIVNGQKRIGTYVQINIAGSLVALVGVGGLAVLGGLVGALYAIALQQAMLSIVTILRSGIRVKDLWGKFDRVCAGRLSGFVLMALTSAICAPIVQLFIRQIIAVQYGWDTAGQWQALNRISDLYLMVVTTPMAIYFLPKFSETKLFADLYLEIKKGLYFIVPIAAMAAMTIFFSREWVVILLFTEEFSPMLDWMAMQLIGDIFRVIGWLLGYAMIAKAMTKSFLILEIVFSSIYLGVSIVLIDLIGIYGVCLAYAMMYMLYSLAATLTLRSKLLVQ